MKLRFIVQGSALKSKGIKQLLEGIATLADVLELKTNANSNSVFLEANINKGFGPVATLIEQNDESKRRFYYF